MPQAMPGVMSASLSDMVRHDLEEHNVDVYTGEKVQRLEGENGVVARVVTDKRTLDADLVIFATGFAPNTALARAAGLDLEERTGAILVNAARGGMQNYPWKMLFPALSICLIVLSFNLLGDGLRDAFDPKLRR